MTYFSPSAASIHRSAWNRLYSISYAEWPAKRCSDGRIEGESTKKRLTERDKRRQSLGG